MVPKRTDNVQLLIPAARFGDENFYKAAPKDGGAGFASGSWNYTDLTTYMPFTKSYDGQSVLTYTNHASDGETAVGILLPKAGAVGQKTVVYASGAGTVNIEKAVPKEQDSVTVTVNGTDYTTDKNGVLTLNYDFKTNLIVDGVAYSTDSMTRKVMTSGNFWYYIGKDGLVHYGKAFYTSMDKEKAAKEMNEIGTVEGVAKAMHLWQGRVLDASGNIYVLKSDATGSTVTAEEDGTVTADLTALETAQPIWMDSMTQVYYYFSLYNGTPIPYRVFRHNGQAYTVSASQNTVYDGVVLSTKTEYGQDTRYFALLNNSGSITPYYSSMKLDTMRNSGIQYISNNLDYSGTVLLAYYEDGNVIGVDYHIGKQVCSTLSQAESFLAYAKNTIANIFSPGGWTLTVSDGSFYDGENFRDQLTEDGQYDSDGTAPITDSDDGQGGEEVSSSGESGGAQVPDGSTEAEGGVEVGGSDAVGGDTAVSGDGSAATNGEIAVNGDTAVSGDGTAGQGSGAAAPGGQAAQSGGSTAQAGADGTASSGSGTAAAPGSGSNGSPGGGFDDTATGQTVEEAMKELFGSLLVAYSDSTGQYEVLDTASLAQGQQVRVADVLAHKNSADSADAAADSADADSGADHSFSVAWGINRSLDTAERQGFVLIALAAGAGMIVLIALFCKVRRRKK